MADQQPLVYSFEATGDDNVRKALEGISGALENSEKAAKATESAFGGLTGGLANAFNKFESIKRGLSEVAGYFAEFAELGDRTDDAFKAMSGSISEATKRLDGQVKSVDLAIARNRAMQAGLQLNDHDFANLTIRAKEFADATGGDMTAAIDQLTGALLSGSARALRPFGIDTGNAKTESGKFAAALASLERQSGDTSDKADTLGAKIDQLKASLSDAAGGFARGVAQSTSFKEALDDLIPNISKSGDTIGQTFQRLGVEVGEFVGVAIKDIKSFTQFLGDVIPVSKIVESVNTALGAIKKLIPSGKSGLLGLLPEGIQAFGIAVKNAIPKSVVDAWDAHLSRTADIAKKSAKNIAEANAAISAGSEEFTGQSKKLTPDSRSGGGENKALAQQAKDLQAIAERAQIEMDWRRKVAEDNERWAEAQREKYIQELTKQVEEGERIEADQFRKRQENLDKEYEARQYLVEVANRKQEEYNEKQKKFAAEIGQYGAAAAAPIAQALDAAAFSGKNLLKAIKEQASAKLRGLGIEYTVRASAEVAEAFAFPALAGTHLLAAAKFAGVAAASFGGAALLGGGGGSATAVTTGGGGSSTTTASGFGNNTTGAGGNAGGGSIIVNVQSLVPTAQTGKVIADSLAATRRQYGYA